MGKRHKKKAKGKSSKEAKHRRASAAPPRVIEQVPTADGRSVETKIAEPIGGFTEALRIDKGFSLAGLDPSSTPGFDGAKKDGRRVLAAAMDEFTDLTERLYAASTAGSRQGVLLVVQGMDTAGKGGIMNHVVSINPQNVQATAFKAPTKEELSHDFLWRIEKALPATGQLGVFDRSHYEDVLIVRVLDLVPEREWSTRYAQINAFERKVARSGTRIIKVMLHISKDEQRARLRERLERPDKYYKYTPGDVDARERWDDYMEAYQAVLDKCSTVGAPWHVVPANRKWYARLAVQQLLLEALRDMDLKWPAADFDIETEKARLAAS
ncbi:MAG: polyphosphate kinase 2 family protein [Micrococcales bacterium]|nr:polyphosphate kinase 2 family protein [Micrococcales bacterium]